MNLTEGDGEEQAAGAILALMREAAADSPFGSAILSLVHRNDKTAMADAAETLATSSSSAMLAGKAAARLGCSTIAVGIVALLTVLTFGGTYFALESHLVGLLRLAFQISTAWGFVGIVVAYFSGLASRIPSAIVSERKLGPIAAMLIWAAGKEDERKNVVRWRLSIVTKMWASPSPRLIDEVVPADVRPALSVEINSALAGETLKAQEPALSTMHVNNLVQLCSAFWFIGLFGAVFFVCQQLTIFNALHHVR